MPAAKSLTVTEYLTSKLLQLGRGDRLVCDSSSAHYLGSRRCHGETILESPWSTPGKSANRTCSRGRSNFSGNGVHQELGRIGPHTLLRQHGMIRIRPTSLTGWCPCSEGLAFYLSL